MPEIKRITNYCNYATWNCDAGERVAPKVSIISLLSVLYALNGRKVTVWILYRYEMAII